MAPLPASDGKDNSHKGLNVPAFVVGALASCFVGTLYGYSYLKDDIKDFWKQEGTDPASLASAIDLGYSMGFFGQYLAVGPGLVFDFFGAAVTCFYGGFLCFSGFALLAMSIPNPDSLYILLPIGLFLAGQGSKGLGFGTLLGTVKMCADSYASMISGVFLFCDACSSVILMLVYDNVWKGAVDKELFNKDTRTNEDLPKIAISMRNFFLSLAILILIVGVVAGVLYMVLIKSADAEEKKKEEEERLEKANKRSQITNRAHNHNGPSYRQEDSEGMRRRNSTSSHGSRNSVNDAAALETFNKLDTENNEDNDIEKNEPVKPKASIPWSAVGAVFFVMFTGEACGLAFNGAIGDSFMSHRKAQFLTTYQNLMEDVKRKDGGNQLFKTIGSEIATDEEIRSVFLEEGKTLGEKHNGVSIPGSVKEGQNNQVKYDDHANKLIEVKNIVQRTLNNIPFFVEIDEGDDEAFRFSPAQNSPDANLYHTIAFPQRPENDIDVTEEEKKDNKKFVQKRVKQLIGTDKDVPEKLFHDDNSVLLRGPNDAKITLGNIKSTCHTKASALTAESSNQFKTEAQINNPICNLELAFNMGYDFDKDVNNKDSQAFKCIISKLKPFNGFLVSEEDPSATDKEQPVLVHFMSHDTHHCGKTSTKKEQKTCRKGHCEPMKITKKVLKTAGEGENVKKSFSYVPLEVKFNFPAYHTTDEEAKRPAQRVLLQRLFKSGTHNHQESNKRGALPGFQSVEYPVLADNFGKVMKSIPFHNWAQGITPDHVIENNKVKPDEAKIQLCKKELKYSDTGMWICDGVLGKPEKIGVEGSKGAEETYLFYDAAASHNNKESAKKTKMILTMCFALSNAAGRLAIGFAASPMEKMSAVFPQASWFTMGCVVNFLIYLLFLIAHPGSVTGTEKDGRETAPILLYVMTVFAAFSYGGMFTINTSFMKTVVPAERVGLVLGLSLVILALGNTAIGQVDGAFQSQFFDVKGHEVGENRKLAFFLMATMLSAVAIIPAMYAHMWQMRVNLEKKNKENKMIKDSCDSDWEPTTESEEE